MIDKETISQLVEESKRNSGCDIRISLHKDPSEEFHNMIILQNKGNYYRPHKHKNKVEAYQIIEGRMAVFIFDDKGSVKECAILSPEKNFIYRIPSNTWHLSIPLTEYVIFNESKPGPFLGEEDNISADWAPDNSNPEEGKKYFAMLLEEFQSGDETKV
ncbi:WbuC family cupin fold metalloprotein [Candidatus Woesearchaeota archaeon]|nr:WbuC family cupin fold metalloprotein [Candidatus Woesearchaeota archaeon]